LRLHSAYIPLPQEWKKESSVNPLGLLFLHIGVGESAMRNPHGRLDLKCSAMQRIASDVEYGKPTFLWFAGSASV